MWEVMWPKGWSNCIKHLEDGNERVQAAELLAGDTSLCIINAYLPTLSLPSSRESYQEMLDVVHSIVYRYSRTHKVVFCGDINGSLLLTRPIPHDVTLRDFVAEHCLCTGGGIGSKPTFFGHSGSSSQIDYILVNPPRHISVTFCSCQ